MTQIKTYPLGSDPEEILSVYDNNGTLVDYSGLISYGVILTVDGKSPIKFGFNLTGFVDDYYTVVNDELLIKIPKEIANRKGTYIAEVIISYTDADYPDNDREVISGKVIAFEII